MPISRRQRNRVLLVLLAVLDAVVLVLAIHAQIDFHHLAGTAQSTSLPIVASFIFGFILSVLLVLSLVETRRSVRNRWR